MVNSNPSLQFNTLDLPHLDQLRTATALIISIAKFHFTLLDELLDPDGFQIGDNFIPLDMSQYKNLLFSTRIPQIAKDEIKQFDSQHITVLFRGNFYKITIINADETIRSAEEILGELIQIVICGRSKKSNTKSITTLSLGNRDRWASNREILQKLGNERALNIIDSSMTLVVLDDFAATSSSQSLWSSIAGPGNNRFPDKSFSLIVGQGSVLII